MAGEPSAADAAPETLDALQARHRKEQRDLVARLAQKKKQATRKTRRGVHGECERLERELQERQDAEVAALTGDGDGDGDGDGASETCTPHEAPDRPAPPSSNTPAPSAHTASTPGDTAHGTKKKANRAKARLARRAADTAALVAAAAAEAANAPSARDVERGRMAVQLERRGLAVHEMRADGHCLYAAVADQLATRAVGRPPRLAGTGMEAYKSVRHAAADFIQAHPDSFHGFTEDPLPEHVRKIRETAEWGGHLELLALARSYGVRICVLQSDGRVDKMEPGDDGQQSGGEAVDEIWLGYYKHSHGLGEHYNSLRQLA